MNKRWIRKYEYKATTTPCYSYHCHMIMARITLWSNLRLTIELPRPGILFLLRDEKESHRRKTKKSKRKCLTRAIGEEAGVHLSQGKPTQTRYEARRRFVVRSFANISEPLAIVAIKPRKTAIARSHFCLNHNEIIVRISTRFLGPQQWETHY